MFDAENIKEMVLDGRLSYRRAVRLFERFLILKAVKKFKTKVRAARFLGLHRNSINNKLKA